MIDLIEILGERNCLSQMLLEQKQFFMSSLQYDANELADKAGIHSCNSKVNDFFAYNGKSFKLLFEANLPETHQHYWTAEMIIGDENNTSENIHIEDDSIIIILIRDCNGRNISGGTLNFLGLPLVVRDGKTSCTFSDIRNNLTKNKISFSTPDCGIVHGHLTF